MSTSLFDIDPSVLAKYGLTPPPPAEPDAAALAAPMNAQPVAPGAGEPMPEQLDTPATPPHLSFLERLMHVPSALEGQFSKEDLNAMRARSLMKAGAMMANSGNAGFLPSLIASASNMQDAFQNELGAGVKQAAAGNEMANTQNLRKVDAYIAQKYPTPAGETAQAKLMRMTQMASDYASMGQPDRAKAMAEAAKNLKSAISPGGEKGFQKVHDTAGNYGIYNPANGQYFFTPEEGWVTNHHDTGVDTQNGFRTRRLNQADLLRIQNMNNFERSKYEEVAKDYDGNPQVKAMGTMHQNYIMLKTTLHDALSNPASSRVVTGQLAAFADPKARLQMQMMSYLSNINPSLAGQFARYASLASTGKLPPAQLRDVSKLVDSIENASEDNMRNVRRNFIKSKAGIVDTDLLDKRIPTVEEAYSTPAQASRATPNILPEAPDEEQ